MAVHNDVVHLCRFTAGLDDLTRRQQGDDLAVLRVLQETKRFSVFEATANQVIAQTMDRLTKRKYIVVDGEVSEFPWCVVSLTEKALALLRLEEGA